MKYYKASACFILNEPFVIQNPGKQQKAAGYYRNFFVAASDEQSLVVLLKRTDTEARLDLADSKIEEVNYDSIPEEIGVRVATTEGVFYQSGRSFFPATSGNQ